MRERQWADALIQEANQAVLNFLITDTETALILLDCAALTTQQEHRTRQITSARKAYDTILTKLPRLSPDEQQLATLNERLATLRMRLLQQGALSSVL